MVPLTISSPHLYRVGLNRFIVYGVRDTNCHWLMHSRQTVCHLPRQTNCLSPDVQYWQMFVSSVSGPSVCHFKNWILFLPRYIRQDKKWLNQIYFEMCKSFAYIINLLPWLISVTNKLSDLQDAWQNVTFKVRIMSVCHKSKILRSLEQHLPRSKAVNKKCQQSLLYLSMLRSVPDELPVCNSFRFWVLHHPLLAIIAKSILNWNLWVVSHLGLQSNSRPCRRSELAIISRSAHDTKPIFPKFKTLRWTDLTLIIFRGRWIGSISNISIPRIFFYVTLFFFFQFMEIFVDTFFLLLKRV